MNTNIMKANLSCGWVFYSPADGTDGHGFYHADECFFEHELNEYKRIYHADDFFYSPRDCTDGHGFFYKNIKNTVYIFRA